MRKRLKQAGRASAGDLAGDGERLFEGEFAAPPPYRVGAWKVAPEMAAAAFLSPKRGNGDEQSNEGRVRCRRARLGERQQRSDGRLQVVTVAQYAGGT